jgi:8-oxo-dGTP pyrophosphatase MutT (NUDIX family)
MRLHDSLRRMLAANLAAHPRRGIGDGNLRPAAVAVAVVGDGDGKACFLLTRRARSLRSHAGQWALPGGRIDAGETVERAATRELSEEVGLAGGDVLGLLDDYPTRSGYRITPVVVWVGGRPSFVLNPREVASVHVVPIAELERPDSPRFVDSPAGDRPVIQLPVFDRLVHAPTAAVLYQFKEVGLHGRDTRVAHLDQPPFAWR